MTLLDVQEMGASPMRLIHGLSHAFSESVRVGKTNPALREKRHRPVVCDAEAETFGLPHGSIVVSEPVHDVNINIRSVCVPSD